MKRKFMVGRNIGLITLAATLFMASGVNVLALEFVDIITDSEKQDYTVNGRNIRGVRFQMGSPADEDIDGEGGRANRDSDETQHDVYLTQNFSMGTTEITQKQWRDTLELAQSKGINIRGLSLTPSEDLIRQYNISDGNIRFVGENKPIIGVSWNDAQAFITVLNELTKDSGTQYRLPTEAEWEYAARAKTTTAYFFGNNSSELNFHAVVYPDSGSQTASVKSKGDASKNGFGLYDMHGNVCEWTEDYYAAYSSTAIDPDQTQGFFRVFRGGSWFDYPRFARSAERRSDEADYRSGLVGFRLVRTPF